MLNKLLTTFSQVDTAPVTDEIKLQGVNWLGHEKSWVLVYFSTSWCAPCKNMTQLMAEVAEHYAEHLKVIKIDVDEQTQWAKNLNVTGVPTLVLLNQAGTKSRLIGGVNTNDINLWLSEQLNL